MKNWLRYAVIGVFGIAVAVAVVERIRYLVIKSNYVISPLPTDREPTEDEKQQWFREIGDHVRVMAAAGNRADLALFVCGGILCGSILIESVRSRLSGLFHKS